MLSFCDELRSKLGENVEIVIDLAQILPTARIDVNQIKQEARAAGYSEETLEKAFAEAKFYQRSIKADKNQPEFKLTLDTYLPRAVPEWKSKKAIDVRYQPSV